MNFSTVVFHVQAWLPAHQVNCGLIHCIAHADTVGRNLAARDLLNFCS